MANRNVLKKITATLLALSMIIPNTSYIPAGAEEADGDTVIVTGFDDIDGDTSYEFSLVNAKEKDDLVRLFPESLMAYVEETAVSEEEAETTNESTNGEQADEDQAEGETVDEPVPLDVTWECDKYNYSAEDFTVDDIGEYTFIPVFGDDVRLVDCDTPTITVSITKAVITAFSEDSLGEESYRPVNKITAKDIEDKYKDTGLTATIDGESYNVGIVGWTTNFEEGKSGEFKFTPIIDDDIYAVDEATIPNVSVNVTEKDLITSISTKLEDQAYTLEDEATASDIEKKASEKDVLNVMLEGSDDTEEIKIKEWKTDYDASAIGTYKFTPVIDTAKYALDENLELPSVEVTVSRTVVTSFEDTGFEDKHYTLSAGKTLKDILSDLNENYGTVAAVTKGGEKVELDITWDSSDFKESEAGKFTFEAEFVSDDYVLESEMEDEGKTAVTAETYDEEDTSDEEKIEETLSMPKITVSVTAGAKKAAPNANSTNGKVTEINQFSIKLVTGAKKNTNGDWVWTPTNDAAGHKFIFRVNYAVSGYTEVDAKEIEIRIPKSIINNKSGSNDDSYEMSLISESEAASMTEKELKDEDWVYKIDGDDIVVYNRQKVSAAESGYFEIAYVTKSKTYEYYDYDPDGTQNYEDASDDFAAKITASGLEKEAGPIPVYIDTSVTLSSTYKGIPTQKSIKIDTSTGKSTWPSTWGSEPANTDLYYWQYWPITSGITRDNSQRYNFSMIDEIISAVDGSGNDISDKFEVYAYRMSGASWSIASNYTDGKQPTVKSLTYDGSRYDYVLTRVKKSDLNGVTSFTVTNKITATVHPIDGVDEDTTKEYTQKFSWTQPTFTNPTGHFYMIKYGDENWGHYYWNYRWHDERDYSYYSLNDFQENAANIKSSADGKITVKKDGQTKEVTKDTNNIEGLEYAVWAYGWPYEWTRDDSDAYMDKDGNTQTYIDYQRYGHKKVTFDVSDSDFYPLNSNGADGNGSSYNDDGTEKTEVQGLAGTAIPGDDYKTGLTPTASGAVKPLGADDYDITCIDFDFYFEDAERDKNGNPTVDEDTMKYIVSRISPSSDDVFRVYTMTKDTDGTGTYVLDGTLNLSTGEYTAAGSDSKVDTSKTTKSKIVFKDTGDGRTNVDGFRITASNAYYHTNMCFYPKVTIFDTDNTENWLGTGKLTQATNVNAGKEINGSIFAKEAANLKNVAYCQVAETDAEATEYDSTTGQPKYKDGEVVYNEYKISGDRMRGTEKNSQIKKKITNSYGNNVRKKSYSITWKVNAMETYTEMKGDVKFLRQESGTFYDLLPAGAVLQSGSAVVSIPKNDKVDPTNWYKYGGNSTRLSETDYKVETIENYKDSGRTMLIVRINTTGLAYDVTYTTIHSWESLTDYGKDVLNPIAYETGNDDITGGFPDDPNAENNDGAKIADSGSVMTSEKNRDIYTGLDSSLSSLTNKYKFIYDEEDHNITNVTAAAAGLTKKVMKANDTTWGYDITVNPDGEYKYRLRYANTYTAAAKGLVLYDTIENFYTADDSDTGPSDWKGVLTSIDTSQMSLLKNSAITGKDDNDDPVWSSTGVSLKPVVYYSTTEDVDMDNEENRKLTSSIWTTETPSDLSKVTAIAIDCSKDEAGNDFILKPGASVSAVLYMKAPHSLNGITTHYTINTALTDEQIDAVKALGLSYVNRVDDTDNSENSYTEFKITTDTTSDALKNETIAKIKTAAGGSYTVTAKDSDQETYNNIYRTCTLSSEDGTFVHEDGVSEDGTPKSVDNEPTTIHQNNTVVRYYIAQSFGLTKVSSKNNEQAIRNITFRLYGTSDYGTEVDTKGITDNNGEITFKNIEKGTYVLQEYATTSDWLLDGTEHVVKIDGAARVYIDDILYVGETTEDGNIIEINKNVTIENSPRIHADISFKKIEQNFVGNKLGGAVYILKGTSDYGTDINKEATSENGTGLTFFADIEKGTYQLYEKTAPAGYVLDDTIYTVIVDENGNYSISYKYTEEVIDEG